MMETRGYTRIANEVIDEHLPNLSCGELRVFLFICRQTVGWNKEADTMSLKQLMDGIGDANKGTGLTKKSVLAALKGLDEKGLVKHERQENDRLGHVASRYSLGEKLYQACGKKDTTLGVESITRVGVENTTSPCDTNDPIQKTVEQKTLSKEKEVEEQPVVERVLAKLRRAFPVVVDEAKWKPQSYANLIERFPLLDHLWNVQELCDYADRNPDWMKKTKDPAGRMRTWFTKAEADRAEHRMNGKTAANRRSHMQVVGTNTQKGPADGTHRVPKWAQDNTKRNLAKLAADYEARHGGPSAAAQ